MTLGEETAKLAEEKRRLEYEMKKLASERECLELEQQVRKEREALEALKKERPGHQQQQHQQQQRSQPSVKAASIPSVPPHLAAQQPRRNSVIMAEHPWTDPSQTQEGGETPIRSGRRDTEADMPAVPAPGPHTTVYPLTEISVYTMGGQCFTVYEIGDAIDQQPEALGWSRVAGDTATLAGSPFNVVDVSQDRRTSMRRITLTAAGIHASEKPQGKGAPSECAVGKFEENAQTPVSELQQEMQHRQVAEVSGWVKKKARYGLWKDRYMRLRDGALLYHSDAKKDSTPNAVFPFWSHIVRGQAHPKETQQFTVSYDDLNGDARDLHFSSRDASRSGQGWVDLINKYTMRTAMQIALYHYEDILVSYNEWYYKDPANVERGPFPLLHLLWWHQNGMLCDATPVKMRGHQSFQPLGNGDALREAAVRWQHVCDSEDFLRAFPLATSGDDEEHERQD